MRGATSLPNLIVHSVPNFNPRSREGSDVKKTKFTAGLKIISIHAPVRGATASLIASSSAIAISIHAPVRGATFLELRFFVPVLYFNPRSREGSDRQIFKIIFYLIISIHAPVRGATSLPNLIVHSVPNFNPRSREGSDSLICNLSSKKEISIHAPVRGATGLSKKSRQYRNISIHAPVRGATLECFSFLVGINNFNPRSREGSDFS